MAEQTVTILARRRDVRPLTAGFLQQQIRNLFGERVGEHRAEAMIRHLRASGRLLEVGFYKAKRHGFRVLVFRLLPGSSSVRKNSPVKRVPWWQHPLFGNPGGAIPVGSTRGQRKRWRREGAWSGG